MWLSGPWPAGSYSDVRIFRNGLRQKLAPFEFVIGDAGYTDTRCLQPPGQSHADHFTFAKVRARHETANRRLKHFAILRNKFVHANHKHADCFYAVLNITVLMIDENPLFLL